MTELDKDDAIEIDKDEPDKEDSNETFNKEKDTIIKTISFHVFFDDNNRTRFNGIMGNKTTLKITLTGNMYQLQGFVCFFFALYGSEGLQTEEMQDMLEYHRGHFEDDINTSDLAAMGERYVIRLIKESDIEEELQFFTCFLEDFVSGMTTVPSQIDTSVENVIKPSNVELKDSDWKNYPFIDLNDPIIYEKYTDVEDDDLDPFEGAPTLRTIQSSNIIPMSFSIEKVNYIIPLITIEQYLDGLQPGKSINAFVKTLEVTHWMLSSWTNIHTIALAQICHQLQVSKLYFSVKDTVYYSRRGDEFFKPLAKCANSNSYPFLSKLRKIESEFRGITLPFWDLIFHSNIRKLTWYIVMPRATNERILDYCDEALEEMDFNYLMESTFSLRQLKFRLPWKEGSSDYDPVDGPFNITNSGNTILRFLERNKKGFKKCVYATVTLLGIRKTKQFRDRRDILGLIILYLWQTRSTEEWTIEK